MKNPQVTAKVTVEETYFTKRPENWDGASWDYLREGVRLPAGTPVTILSTTNAGFRGIEHHVTTADGWTATISEYKLANR